ncbi:MAG TPA: LexA family transcriptional regulator [Armatimonadota bacterium]|nr:LexA family transcriptional regulator [Armatimonadota bacterium]
MAAAPRFGEIIRQYRTRAGLGQRELGERIGVSESWVAAIEAERHRPTIERLEQLVVALGCTSGEAGELRELNLSLRANREGRELAEILMARAGSAGQRGTEGVVRHRFVPVLILAVGEDPRLGGGIVTERYPVAEDTGDEELFLWSVIGDGMAPRLSAGTLVVVSPGTQLRAGAPALCMLTSGLVCALWSGEGDKCRLGFLNPDHPARLVPRDEVVWCYAIVKAYVDV